MEAVAAFGLAANVLAFIEATTGFTRQVKRVVESGTDGIAELKRLKTVMPDLERLLGELQTEESSQNAGESPTAKLATDCSSVLEDLIRTMAEVAEPPKKALLSGTKREAILAAFRARWNRDKIERLEDLINGFRQQLVLNLLVNIRYAFRSQIFSTSSYKSKAMCFGHTS
jgi:hypothetical protein